MQTDNYNIYRREIRCKIQILRPTKQNVRVCVCLCKTVSTELEKQSSETATTVAIVITADEGIFSNCGDFYIPLRIISSSS
ncbi:hypothetical protein Q7C36_014593 [Tachysurus vachellii]|uniref:Uncharacterized protein n=1 Tax=Tachysurus vachellii TaxID=175792 RepID=A0AA88MHZ5_TACVA|nr:hypothetical protein Q7C36_014593 [Tachysurus vachellii]